MPEVQVVGHSVLTSSFPRRTLTQNSGTSRDIRNLKSNFRVPHLIPSIALKLKELTLKQ